jgi:hypothetical protein
MPYAGRCPIVPHVTEKGYINLSGPIVTPDRQYQSSIGINPPPAGSCGRTHAQDVSFFVCEPTQLLERIKT